MAGDSEIRDFAARHRLDAVAAEELRELLRTTVREALTPVTGASEWSSRPRFRTVDSETTSEVSVRDDGPAADRYEDQGVVGTGGMAEVRRVWDPELHRSTAMKVLWPEYTGDIASVARFVREARTTARLEHPGVVPVHEIGRLADGRWYFTMEEVRGRTLADVITDVHHHSRDGVWGTGASGWTFRRLIQTFRKVCETVAYAHSQRVVHRDIKPKNIMVGEYGETLVLDWGLAKSLDGAPEPSLAADVLLDELEERAGSKLLDTPKGWVVGTPTYMPPELARGGGADLDPTVDVYSLGAVFYELLSGRLPYRGEDGREVLRQLAMGPPPPLDDLPATTAGEDEGAAATRSPPIPPELRRICETAMAREPSDRYPDARGMADAVIAWLEGAQRRDRALAYTTRADALRPEVRRLRSQATLLAAEADRLLSGLPASAPPAEKRAAWSLEDAAERLRRDADLQEVELIRLAQSALTHHSGLPEARALLADHYREQHEEAERAKDSAAAARFEALLKAYDMGRHAQWLAGEGELSLVTDPEGADVGLYRWVARERVLVAEQVRDLGTTPLRSVRLPAGSYLLRLSARGRQGVELPVRIDRGVHEDGRSPGGEAAPIELPPLGELGANDVFIPPGMFRAGGDPDAPGGLEASRPWVAGFVIRRYPVTNAEYLDFLNDLLSTGRAVEAEAHVPRLRAMRQGEVGTPAYTLDGTYQLGVDADGDRWLPDWPVIFVDHPSALAFARWEAERTGRPWRLPTEHEWEKAARGVDGRFYPWGDRFDPTFCRMRQSLPGGHGMLAAVGTHPVDCSPQGVMDMAGNVVEWCGGEVDTGDGHSLRVRRGGSWTFSARGVRSAARWVEQEHFRAADLGFRLARSAG